MTETKEIKRVLILGGGFGGLQVARDLANAKDKNISISLITNKDYFEYYPALYRIVTGSSPIEVCVPLKDVIPKNVEVFIDRISSVNLSKKIVFCQTGVEHEYDSLVIALGSETTYFNLPGLEDLSLGFKSIDEALNLKNHIQELFKAHRHPDQKEMVSHFHIVIVGGGASGIEVAGNLTSYMQELAKIYKVDSSLITIDIIESSPRLAANLPEAASARMLLRLRKLGVNVYLNRSLVKEEIEEVYLKDMSMKAKTVIWTAGTQINKIVQKIDGLTLSAKRRVEVDEYMQAKGWSDVYAIGDIADTPYSGLAQTAIYDGKYVSEEILKQSSGKVRSVYIPKKNAFIIPVGRWWAAMSVGNIRIYGVFAYMVRHIADFIFFAKIVSVHKLFSLFFEGWKYRKNHLPKNK